MVSEKGSSGSREASPTVENESPSDPQRNSRPPAAGRQSDGSAAEPGRAITGTDGFGYKHLHLEVTGRPDAEPILLLHGWGSNAENMHVIARALETDYHVFNVDLPGHGHSPPPPNAIGVPEHASLVADLIKNEIGSAATVIGHSNGGRIALYMASDPSLKSLIRRLVLISPSGITPERSAGYYFRRTTSRVLKAPFEILPEPLRDFGLDWLRHSLVWRALGSSDYRALQGTMRETFVKTVTHHVDDRIADIEAPTLLIWGNRDTAVSKRQMQVLESRIPDAGLLVLEDAGHYGYLDDFDTFIGATRYFLQNS